MHTYSHPSQKDMNRESEIIMETPSIMQIKTFKYNLSSPPPSAQQSNFFNTTDHNNTTSTAMETSQPHHNYKPPAAFTQNNLIPRDANSFNAYLKPPLPSPPPPPPPRQEDSEISIFDAQKYFNDTNPDTKKSPTSFTTSSTIISSCTKTVSNLDHDHLHANYAIPRLSSSSSSIDGGGYNRIRSFHATPTASSEASWNSQTGLLSNPPGGLAVSLKNLPDHHHLRRENKRGITNNSGGSKWFFGRKCPCTGKKSVQVEEIVIMSSESSRSPPAAAYAKRNSTSHHHQNRDLVQETEISDRQSLKSVASSQLEQFQSKVFQHKRPPLTDVVGGGGFSFPILKNPSGFQPPRLSLMDDPPRESLEVFQPAEEPTVARKSGGRGFGFPGSPIARVAAMDDDMASDASSDLFEIESFSTQTTTYPMYRRRDSLDEAQNFHTRRLSGSNIYGRRSMDEPMTPSIAPTECYEPSEASIDWSVTTAEGFDRASVTNFSISASEFDDVAMPRHGWVNHGGEGGRKKGNGGLLMMSCRHEKAVSVGPQPVKYAAAATAAEEVGQDGPGALMSTFMHVSSRGPSSKEYCYSNNKKKTVGAVQPQLARSHSARLSLAFVA